jgi:glycosyltransferase involved in cell wall biosynthesis
MVGRIAEWKGQHIFLRAASIVLEKHRDVVFQVVGAPLFGEEEYEQSLFKLSQELGIDNSVEFLGFREDVPQIVGSCDILVHASIIGEPFGQVVVEGMALGKPVVATNGGALPEIVVQGETGLLVGMGNVEEMADAIEQLLANRPKAYEMGQRGRKRVLDHFTTDRSAARIHQVYEQILVGAAKVTNTTDVTVEAAKP